MCVNLRARLGSCNLILLDNHPKRIRKWPKLPSIASSTRGNVRRMIISRRYPRKCSFWKMTPQMKFCRTKHLLLVRLSCDRSSRVPSNPDPYYFRSTCVQTHQAEAGLWCRRRFHSQCPKDPPSKCCLEESRLVHSSRTVIAQETTSIPCRATEDDPEGHHHIHFNHRVQ